MQFVNFNIFFSLQGHIDECTNKEEEKEWESSKTITQSMTKNIWAHRNISLFMDFKALRPVRFVLLGIVIV